MNAAPAPHTAEQRGLFAGMLNVAKCSHDAACRLYASVAVEGYHQSLFPDLEPCGVPMELAKTSIILVNVGAALEILLKLLVKMEKRDDPPSGSKGHSLDGLFKNLTPRYASLVENAFNQMYFDDGVWMQKEYGDVAPLEISKGAIVQDGAVIEPSLRGGHIAFNAVSGKKRKNSSGLLASALKLPEYTKKFSDVQAFLHIMHRVNQNQLRYLPERLKKSEGITLPPTAYGLSFSRLLLKACGSRVQAVFHEGA